jgi:UDP-N-acetylglucosamine 1-carboxyvinyltransferase
VAGLVAHGETIVHDIHHIDRGYDDLVGRLSGLGADVTRV